MRMATHAHSATTHHLFLAAFFLSDTGNKYARNHGFVIPLLVFEAVWRPSHQEGALSEYKTPRVSPL